MYKQTLPMERLQKWLEEEDYAVSLKKEYAVKWKHKKKKFFKSIQKFKKDHHRKRRCSNCLHSGHNKATCKNPKATIRQFKLFKEIKKKKYKANSSHQKNLKAA